MNITTEGDIDSKTCLLVDDNDQVLETCNIQQCHQLPTRKHRAFSLFIFQEGRLLMQQRSMTKYTFPLAWTNSVCSHPRNLDHDMRHWISIRTKDELGLEIDETQLEFITKIDYNGESDLQYGENEIDHVYMLNLDQIDFDLFNRDEIHSVKLMDDQNIQTMMKNNLFTPWFCSIYNLIKQDGKTFHQSMMESAMEFQSVDVIHRLGNVTKARADSNYDHILRVPMLYYLSMPAKEVRTAICMELGKLTNQDPSITIDLVNRIHNASLLHDDIEDKSIIRRGMPCAHLMYGVARVLNSGTFEMVSVIHDAFKYNTEYGFIVAETIENLHRGQNADIYWTEMNVVPTLEEYLEMIRGKTGALFIMCARLMISDPSIVDYCDQLGRYFQLRDDYCNLTSIDYWQKKGFCEDFDEGKYGYPALKYIATGNATEWFLDTKQLCTDKLRAFEEIQPFLNQVREELVLIHQQLMEEAFTEGMKKILERLNVPDVPSLDDAKRFLNH